MSRRKKKKIPYHEKVEIFVRSAKELAERRFVLEGLNEFQFHINIDNKTKKIKTEIREGDVEDFRSFLITFRKFILEGEPTNVNRLFVDCCRFLKKENCEISRALDWAKAAWKTVYEKGIVRITSNGINLTPKFALNLYCSYYFHNDDIEKRHQLTSLLANDVPAVKIQLLWSLPILTEIIIRTQSILKNALREDAFQFPDG